MAENTFPRRMITISFTEKETVDDPEEDCKNKFENPREGLSSGV
jgi:hypothetical protein